MWETIEFVSCSNDGKCSRRLMKEIQRYTTQKKGPHHGGRRGIRWRSTRRGKLGGGKLQEQIAKREIYVNRKYRIGVLFGSIYMGFSDQWQFWYTTPDSERYRLGCAFLNSNLSAVFKEYDTYSQMTQKIRSDGGVLRLVPPPGRIVPCVYQSFKSSCRPLIQLPSLPKDGERNILVTSALPYCNNVPHLGKSSSTCFSMSRSG